MLALFISFLLYQTYADTTWTKYGATLENTHYQIMKGAMTTTPVVKWSYQTGYGGVESGPSVADVDNDGIMEIVVGSFEANKVYCFTGVNGNLKWSYTTGYYITSSPAIADVDNDGQYEVVIGSWDRRIYCLTGANGVLKWNHTTGGQVWSSPAIADVDNDAQLEVVVGSNDNKVYCLTGVNGNLEWSYVTGGDVYSSPAIADVDDDGQLEVVIGSYDNKVYCLTGANGSIKWSYITGAGLFYFFASSPALADVDNDGQMEVVIGSCDYKVYCLTGANGNLKWSYSADGDVHMGISVADLDKDNILEVLVPSATDYTPNSIICLNGENGMLLWKKRLGTAHDIHDITIADIDTDGCVELVVGTYAEVDTTDNKIWTLDDSGDTHNCGGSSGVEEGRGDPLGRPIAVKVIGTTLQLFVQNPMEVDMKLYDLCGRMQEVIYKGVLSKGMHNFILHIKNSGIYFAVVHTHKASQVIKVIKF